MSNKESFEMVGKLNKALISKQISRFQFDVYNQLLKVPQGKVTTYKEIAKAVKCNSAQAIGQALRKNPFAPEVPCHRVVKTDLTLGGFSGSITNKTVEKKMKLLQDEGVKFTATINSQCSQAKVDNASIWAFTNSSEL